MNHKERNDKNTMSLNRRVIHVMWILLMLYPVLLTAQVTFSRIPMDKQLVARDTATNIGQVIVSGQVEYTGIDPDYVKMRIEILKEGSSYAIEDTPVLQYNNKKADFDFSVGIEAKFANYSIIIRAIKPDDNFDPIITEGGGETTQPSKETTLSGHLNKVVDLIFDYVEKTDFAALGVIGVFVLFLAVFSVMSSIEQAMNDIWTQLNKERKPQQLG